MGDGESTAGGTDRARGGVCPRIGLPGFKLRTDTRKLFQCFVMPLKITINVRRGKHSRHNLALRARYSFLTFPLKTGMLAPQKVQDNLGLLLSFHGMGVTLL